MSGGIICSVFSCKSVAKGKKETGEHISFHRFPKDPQLRKEWIRRCYRNDYFKPDNKRVCGKHFHREDFEDLCRAKIMNVAPKKLKSTALPCLNLKFTSCTCSLKPAASSSTDNRLQKVTRTEQKLVVRELAQPKAPVGQVRLSQIFVISTDKLSQPEIEIENRKENTELCQNGKHKSIVQSRCDSLNAENEALKRDLEKIKEQNRYLLRKNKQLAMYIIHLQNNNKAKEVIFNKAQTR